MKSSGVADSREVGDWIIPDAGKVDVADIDVEVVYRVCNSGPGDVKVATVKSNNAPTKKPVPKNTCVDVRIKVDQALRIDGPSGTKGTYDLVFVVPRPLHD